MKHTLVAGLIALSLGFSTMAFAKDIPSIELFSGDYVGIAGIEADQLATRDLYKKAVSDSNVKARYEKSKAEIAKWSDGKIDAEKDIDLVLVAVPTDYSKSEHVMILEFHKDLKDVIAAVDAKLAADAAVERRDVDGSVVYIEKRTNEWTAILDDKRVAVGTEREVKAILASKKAGKAAKSIKKNAALYKQYEAANKKADIWGAFALTSKEIKQLDGVVLDAADGKSFKANEIDSGNAAINLASGLDLKLNAHMKSANSAADGAKVLSDTLGGFLGDPALNDMGLGFLATGIKVTSSKSDIVGSIKFAPAELDILIGLAKDAGAEMIQQAAPAKAPVAPAKQSPKADVVKPAPMPADAAAK